MAGALGVEKENQRAHIGRVQIVYAREPGAEQVEADHDFPQFVDQHVRVRTSVVRPRFLRHWTSISR
ncbi:hypothetical protein [Rhodococcoides corynebacterioides]|uniref:hypothetical protein n=1 Tax=Rhodococcoides corynebacterioides TaxID=53972 RepID=UPI0027E1C2C6|nr:hypothetical protein [Rhodococcus corynebacterioides]